MQRMWTSYILESTPIWQMDCERRLFQEIFDEFQIKKKKIIGY